ncbi:MAG: hypothetical protein KGM43_16855 [Planctomycetota bacterium]|nr:hypothetical protein [Planctomycetota bacterium]
MDTAGLSILKLSQPDGLLSSDWRERVRLTIRSVVSLLMIRNSFRTATLATLATLATFAMALLDNPLSAQPKDAAVNAASPGEIVKASLRQTTSSKVGDLIQIELTYPIIPNSMLSALDVKVEGEAARFVTVVSTPVLAPNGQTIIGEGALSAFLVAERSGTTRVRVRPVKLNGSRGDEQTYDLKISERD